MSASPASASLRLIDPPRLRASVEPPGDGDCAPHNNSRKLVLTALAMPTLNDLIRIAREHGASDGQPPSKKTPPSESKSNPTKANSAKFSNPENNK
jgi:hypothetical protein